MPVFPFNSDQDVTRFAKAFLDNHIERFKKDITICLTADQNKSHAYFPALITCIAFADLLSGLHAGKLERQGLKELKDYVWQFIDSTKTVYDEDRLNVLYECFRHKVAHLALPYAVFDTPTKPKIFRSSRRLITWTVHARGPRPSINIVQVASQPLRNPPTPWQVIYDHRVIVSVSGLASDIVKSIPKYLRHLKTDPVARRRFRDCMPSYFPR